MGEEGGHYYDGKTFTPFLKDISGNTSIIYRYDEDHTYLASNNSIYHTSTDISYVRFHNQIMGISGETITHANGKNVDVMLNKYINGDKTDEEVSTDISNYPFIGNYSIQTIEGVPNVKVLDLFEYTADTYTFIPLDTNNTTYNDVYKLTDTHYDRYDQFGAMIQFNFVNNQWVSIDSILYNPPKPNYSYGRLKNYNYPDINVNNVLTSRGDYGNPKDIANELVLPTLP